jgi:hypothetical protein
MAPASKETDRMDTHAQSIDVHEARPGAGDEPVAAVAVTVLVVLGLGVMILWWFSSTH